jgi:hypothetical protein
MIYGLCLGIGSCNVCVVNARKTIWVLLVITEKILPSLAVYSVKKCLAEYLFGFSCSGNYFIGSLIHV